MWNKCEKYGAVFTTYFISPKVQDNDTQLDKNMPTCRVDDENDMLV
jgi:hypothetical protein